MLWLLIKFCWKGNGEVVKKVIFLVLVIANTLVLSAEAKTYVGNEFSYSIWVPNEMEYAYVAPPNSDDVITFRAELRGLNVSVMTNRTPIEKREFHDENNVLEIMELKRQLRFANVNDHELSYACPVENHYYIFEIKEMQDRVYAEMSTVVHGTAIVVMATGPIKYKETAKKIVTSFKCLKE